MVLVKQKVAQQNLQLHYVEQLFVKNSFTSRPFESYSKIMVPI